MRRIFLIVPLLLLAACAGHEKGTDVGIGFDVLNTTSKEEKENDAWFKSFYGSNHCYGNWASECKSDEGGGAGSGGFWGGGVGPSDGGSSSSSSN